MGVALFVSIGLVVPAALASTSPVALHWSAPVSVTGGRQVYVDGPELGCSSARLCVLASTDDVEVFNGRIWSKPAPVPGIKTGVSSVQCAQAVSLCTAIDNDEPFSYVTFDGKTWSKPISLAPTQDSLEGVSCINTRFCLATYSTSFQAPYRETYYSVYNGSSWTAGKGFYANYAQFLDCVSAKFCMAADANAFGLLQFNGASWKLTSDHKFTGFGWALSCASASLCVLAQGGPPGSAAGRNPGGLLTFDGRGWSAPFRTAGPEPAVSCARGLCVAVVGVEDTAGNLGSARVTGSDVYYATGKGWSGPMAVADAAGLIAVACPTSKFCVAVDGRNRVVIGHA